MTDKPEEPIWKDKETEDIKFVLQNYLAAKFIPQFGKKITNLTVLIDDKTIIDLHPEATKIIKKMNQFLPKKEQLQVVYRLIPYGEYFNLK
mgnify:CR=1 FL=1